MEQSNTVTINGTEFKVKNTLRALFVFEQIAGKPFALESSLDNFLFLYSVVLACNPDKAIGWNEFIDAMDADKDIFEKMNAILNKGNEIEKLLEGTSEDADVQKKN